MAVLHSQNRRTEIKRQPLRRVASELVRLAVFQSHCPVGRRLKPATRRLAPFPSADEMLHALAIYFLIQDSGEDSGKTRQADMDYLRDLHLVFKHLSERLRDLGEAGAAVNGLVTIDAFSQLFAASAPDLIRKIIEEYRNGQSS